MQQRCIQIHWLPVHVGREAPEHACGVDTNSCHVHLCREGADGAVSLSEGVLWLCLCCFTACMQMQSTLR